MNTAPIIRWWFAKQSKVHDNAATNSTQHFPLNSMIGLTGTASSYWPAGMHSSEHSLQSNEMHAIHSECLEWFSHRHTLLSSMHLAGFLLYVYYWVNDDRLGFHSCRHCDCDGMSTKQIDILWFSSVRKSERITHADKILFLVIHDLLNGWLWMQNEGGKCEMKQMLRLNLYPQICVTDYCLYTRRKILKRMFSIRWIYRAHTLWLTNWVRGSEYTFIFSLFTQIGVHKTCTIRVSQLFSESLLLVRMSP